MESIVSEDSVSAAPMVEPRLGATVYGDGSVLKLSGALLATAAVPSKRRELVERLFLLPDLARVNVQQRLGAITLRFLKGGFNRAELLDALAAAMRRRVITEHSFPNQHLLSRHEFRSRFEVHRAGERLTLWRINPSGSKRLTLVHALLQHDKVRASVMDSLLSLVGITTVISRRQREIEIALQPNRLSKWALLEVIESALAEALPLSRGTKTNFKLRPALIRANLALAPIADYVFPPLGWASAAVITTLGVGHLGPAVARWKQKRTGLDLLYACICFCTLSTFTFLPSALMYALLQFWPKQSEKIRQENEANFLARLRRLPRKVLVDQAGKLAEVNRQDLKPGDVVILKRGDVAPGDGTIICGEATLHEGILTGSSSPARKTKGGYIYATTEIIEGDILVRIGTGETLANRLTELFTAAFARPDDNSHALRLAEMLVTPIILAGVAALGRGGIHMTKAVMRPDFLCGPSVVEEFGDLWVVLRAAERGIVVLDTAVLDPIFKADYWIFDDTVTWQLAETNEDLLRSFKSAGREIVFLSDDGSKQVLERDGRLTFSRLDVGGSSAAKRTFVARRQSQGQSVVYFGDCERECALANLADVAVTVKNGDNRLTAGIPIAFLSPDLEKFGALHALCQRRNTEVTNGFISTALPNVFAMVAAIYFHAPALFSVAMTTLGTIFCYRRASGLLKESSPELDIVPESTN
jgi:E1-E2 ATPase